MVFVRKQRRNLVIPIAIGVGFLLITLVLLLWLWPSRSPEPRKHVEAPIETAPALREEPPPPPTATTTSPRENEDFITMRVKQVYADNATRLYYPEKCPNRPEKAYKIARSLAIKQGFKLAPQCSE
jgi:hypothetical protein